MKCSVKIDKDALEDEVIIIAKEKSKKIFQLENYILGLESEFIGYKEKEATKLSLNDIYCFTIEENRVVAITEKERYTIKERLYNVETLLTDNFLRINQSTIVNINKIDRFNASFVGSLMIIMKNGFKDFVSRRQLKKVKEKIGGKAWNT